MWKETRLVQMLSTFHYTNIENTGRKDRKTNMVMKKPYAVIQYNKLMKGMDRAEHYLSYHSVLRKIVKWSIMVLLHLLNCTPFNAFFCIHDIKYKQKSKVHELPAWATKVLDIRNPESKWVQFWSTSIAREASKTKGA